MPVRVDSCRVPHMPGNERGQGWVNALVLKSRSVTRGGCDPSGSSRWVSGNRILVEDARGAMCGGPATLPERIAIRLEVPPRVRAARNSACRGVVGDG